MCALREQWPSKIKPLCFQKTHLKIGISVKGNMKKQQKGTKGNIQNLVIKSKGFK